MGGCLLVWVFFWFCFFSRGIGCFGAIFSVFLVGWLAGLGFLVVVVVLEVFLLLPKLRDNYFFFH